jgi:hypothetical protein
MTFGTMDAGYTSVDQHLEAIRAFIEVMRPVQVR